MPLLHRSIVSSLLALVTSFLVAGCGGSSVVVNPDYNHPELHKGDLKRGHIRIVNVTDGRSDTSSRIGTARVGMFNKHVPYTLNGNVAEFIKTILDTLIVGRHDQDRFVPISVSVDMFDVGENMKLFSEEGYFACNLGFNYPVTPDSLEHKAIFIKQTENSIVDVTNSIEMLIYKGLAQCARIFVEGTLDKNQDMLLVSPDSAAIMRSMDSMHVESLRQIKNKTPEGAMTVDDDRLKTDELSFHYAQGSKIKTGIRVAYSMLSQTNGSRFTGGLGIALTYYDIENKKDLLKGNFISFSGKLVGKYYFNDSPTTFYIGGNLGLSGGSERVTYGSYEKTYFFFGPTVEEVLGLSLDRKLSLEFGSFQLAHFGSKILPSDIGFIVGLSFRL